MTTTPRTTPASSLTTTAATAMATLNTAATTIRTLVALDAGLPDLPLLLAGLSPGVEALLVPSDGDAIALITAALQRSGASLWRWWPTVPLAGCCWVSAAWTRLY